MTLFWRIVFLLAIFGNLLFFAWSQGYFGRLEDGREPLRIKHQLAPEKLRILAAAPESSAASAVPASVAAATADAAICRLVGDNALPAADAQRLYERVQTEATAGVAGAESGVAASLQAVVKPIELPPRYWVHFPPLPNRELVDRKLQELRNLGITDAMPMLGEGDDHFAISLGMFSTPEAAETHLAAMQRRGVRTAVIEKRARATGATGKAQVEVRGPQALVLQRLPELLNELGLAKAHVADCPETDDPAKDLTKDSTSPASP